MKTKSRTRNNKAAAFRVSGPHKEVKIIIGHPDADKNDREDYGGIIRIRVAKKNDGHKSGKWWSRSRLRQLVDDYLSSTKPLPIASYGRQCVGSDPVIPELVTKYGRGKHGIVRALYYIFIAYDEYGRRGSKIGTMLERIEGTKSSLDPTRELTLRDEYAFRLMSGYRVRKGPGQFVALSDEDIQMVLGVTKGRIKELRRRFPRPIFVRRSLLPQRTQNQNQS